MARIIARSLIIYVLVQLNTRIPKTGRSEPDQYHVMRVLAQPEVCRLLPLCPARSSSLREQRRPQLTTPSTHTTHPSYTYNPSQWHSRGKLRVSRPSPLSHSSRNDSIDDFAATTATSRSHPASCAAPSRRTNGSPPRGEARWT
jgi:hypothetical protein